jgi:hypothetical protein
MRRLLTPADWRPTNSTLAAAALVTLGLLLCSLTWKFLWLVALGTFGPGVLREFGWLDDEDEFRRQAARRAGYHAYLAGGLLTFFLLGVFRDDPAADATPAALLATILVVMWFTWLLSSLFSFWGARRATVRLLLTFGMVWLLFNLLANTGSEYSGPVAIFMQCSLALPFFGAAYCARRWPRLAGLLLLLFALFFFLFFHLYEIIGSGDPLGKGRAIVLTLFVGPLVAGGVGLLRSESTA